MENMTHSGSLISIAICCMRALCVFFFGNAACGAVFSGIKKTAACKGSPMAQMQQDMAAAGSWKASFGSGFLCCQRSSCRSRLAVNWSVMSTLA